MSHIKTAISVDEVLFTNIDALVKEKQWSRSRFFELAAIEYLRKCKNSEMLDQINEVFPKGLSKEDKQIQKYALENFAEFLEDEAW